MKRSIFFSVLGAAVATVLLGGTYALATNMTFLLGAANHPDALTTVTAQNKDTHGGLNGPMIQLTNSSTAGAATPLGLTAGKRRPPFTTNSSTRVVNLDADLLDGMNSTAFVQGAGGQLLASKVSMTAGASREIFTQNNPPPFNMIFDCPSDLATAGTATFFNRSTLDADLVIQSQFNSGATHGGYGTSISLSGLDSELTFNAGWSDGHVATVWVFVNNRETGAPDDGCYLNIMALTR